MDSGTPKGEFLQTVRQALGKASPSIAPQSTERVESREHKAEEIKRYFLEDI